MSGLVCEQRSGQEWRQGKHEDLYVYFVVLRWLLNFWVFFLHLTFIEFSYAHSKSLVFAEWIQIERKKLFLRFYLFFIFRERKGWEKERERNINVWLPLMWPPLGTWPAIQKCTLTGNQTSDHLVCSPCSTHWATPVTVKEKNFKDLN